MSTVGQHRNPALDGMRGVAVLSVVAFHANQALPGGYVGVNVFFALSGYLITSILLAEHAQTGRIDLKRFFVRRMTRLLPALIAMLAVVLAVAPLVWPEYPFRDHVIDALISLFYLADYARAFYGRPEILRHMWSLSVEEQYYLLWPITLIGVLLLRSGRHRLLTVLALGLIAEVWRCYSANDYNWDEIYNRGDTRMAGLFLGSALGIAVAQGWQLGAVAAERVGALSLLCLAIAAAMFEWGPVESMRSGMFVVNVAAVGLVASVVHHREHVVARMLCLPWVRRVGILSYGIYLWHYPLLFQLRDSFDWPVALAITIPFSLVAAMISRSTVEAAALRWRDRHVPPPLVQVLARETTASTART